MKTGIFEIVEIESESPRLSDESMRFSYNFSTASETEVSETLSYIVAESIGSLVGLYSCKVSCTNFILEDDLTVRGEYKVVSSHPSLDDRIFSISGGIEDSQAIENLFSRGPRA